MTKGVATKIYRGITIAMLVFLLAMAVLVVGAFYVYTHKPLPVLQGKKTVPGLHSHVSVVRDKWGVPHIFAKDMHDLMFASGYVQAQDRLFQMDLLRRAAEGRLSEWFGPEALGHDRLARTVGFARHARRNAARAPALSLEALRAFARGVNALAGERRGNLPAEYKALPGGFEPWTVEDSLAVALYTGWGLTGDWKTELLRLGIAGERGKAAAFEIMPLYESEGPCIIPPSAWPGGTEAGAHDRKKQAAGPGFPVMSARSVARLISLDRSFRSLISSGVLPSASNSWVVDGTMTESGKPILCNDPHLDLTLPSVWYQLHLAGAGMNVAGATFPGIPVVVLGHNRDIAWAATTTGADMDDLFVLEVHPEDPGLYLYNGEWIGFETVEETIKVKPGNGPPHYTMKVRIARQGPVINDVLDPPVESEAPLALAWTGYELTDPAGAFIEVALAADWESFRKGIQKLGVPVQNWLFAGRDGDIGYIAAGLFPVRPRHFGAFPAPGTGAYDWQGFAPLDELPQVKNPDTHYLVTANNRVMPQERVPYVISYNYDPPYRAMRIVQMIEAGAGRWTAGRMAEMQMDTVSLRARRLMPVFMEVLAKHRGEREEFERAWRQLEGWEFDMEADEAAPAIFAEAYWQAFRLTYEDEMSEELFHPFRQIQSMENAFDNILSSGESGLFDDRRTEKVEDREDVVLMALEEALKVLAEKAGPRMTGWEWGRLHKLHLKHPMGEAGQLQGILDLFRVNRGPFPMPGGRNTVNKAAYLLGDREFRVKAGPSMRHVVDLGALDDATMSYPGGQSGQPFSAHYADLVKDWLEGSGHPMPMTREGVEKYKKAVLELAPACGAEG